MNVEIRTPRTVSKQTNRANPPSSTSEEYFLRSIYIPLLDNVIADVISRFPQDVLNSFGLNILIPANLNCDADLTTVASQYSALLEAPLSVLQNEYKLWIRKWQREIESGSNVPKTAIETIEMCDMDIYPNIAKLLYILATLPVSVATAERTFSALKRLKTWLRNSMAQERLTGLALLNIHKDIDVSVDNIIERFAKSKRKLEFSL